MQVRVVIFVVVLLGSAGPAPAQEAAPSERVSPLTPPSFTALFRQLLSAPQEEQQKLLAQKPAAAQQLLLEKLEEYRGLPTAERQRRLHLLDLRWYITQLRYVAPSNRITRLATIPEPDRQLVEDRLAIWDALTPQQKLHLLLYDVTRNYLDSPPPALPPSPPGLVMNPSSNSAQEEALKRWRSLPLAKQSEILQHFKSVFDDEPTPPLPEGLALKQQHVINTLKQMEPGQREKYVQGFQKFVALSPPERERFMNNFTRWNKMTPAARNAWSTLAEHLPLPPSPPGLHVNEVGTPPAPPPPR